MTKSVTTTRPKNSFATQSRRRPEGGVTNGERSHRGHLKPISTLRRALRSVDIDTKQEERAAFERSDITVVPAAGSLVKHGRAWSWPTRCEKFGGDSLGEMKRNFEVIANNCGILNNISADYADYADKKTFAI
jgi:chorismate synthase